MIETIHVSVCCHRISRSQSLGPKQTKLSFFIHWGCQCNYTDSVDICQTAWAEGSLGMEGKVYFKHVIVFQSDQWHSSNRDKFWLKSFPLRIVRKGWQTIGLMCTKGWQKLLWKSVLVMKEEGCQERWESVFNVLSRSHSFEIGKNEVVRFEEEFWSPRRTDSKSNRFRIPWLIPWFSEMPNVFWWVFGKTP